MRVSARTLGASGFLFVNNHVRGYDMPVRKGFQVEVKLPAGETMMLPEKPVDVPADAYFVWPFHEDLGGLKLRFATAQPLARLGTEKAPVYAFFAQPGIDVEFVVDGAAGMLVDRRAGVELKDGAVWVRGLKPGPEEKLRFTLANGSSVTLLASAPGGC